MVICNNSNNSNNQIYIAPYASYRGAGKYAYVYNMFEARHEQLEISYKKFNI